MSSPPSLVRSPAEGNSTYSTEKMAATSPSPRVSIDSGTDLDSTSVNLNDDLADISQVSSSSINTSSYINNNTRHFHRGGSRSIASYRNSMDADSLFLASQNTPKKGPGNTHLMVSQQYSQGQTQSQSQQHFQPQPLHNQELDSHSPLGPNSIHKLTLAADLARRQRNKPPRTHVTINGGLTTVYNLNTPSVSCIPQIQLVPLQDKVSSDELKKLYASNARDIEYKKFDSARGKLTEGMLQKLQQQQEEQETAYEIEIEDNLNHVGGAIAALGEIPLVFSDANFRLDDQRTFKKVVDNASILPTDELEDYLLNNTAVQEKLLHYLDVVEIALVEEISKSSNSFFNTIDEIQEIEDESKGCAEQFDSLLNKLESIETNECMKGLDILNKIKIRQNVNLLEESILQIQEIVQYYEVCVQQLENKQYTQCLQLIVNVEELIRGEARKGLLDFSRLPALFDIQNNLHKNKETCKQEYIKEFVNELTKDLHIHFESVLVEDSLCRMSGKKVNNAGMKQYQTISQEIKDNLTVYVVNLVNSGGLKEAYRVYQDRIINEVKEIIKVNLPRRDSNTSSRSNSVPPQDATDMTLNDSFNNVLSGGASSLSTNLRSMSPMEFLTMLTRTFTNLSECLRRLTTHQKLLLDLALTSIPPTDDIDVMSLDISESINKAIEITQIRLTKVINVRLELLADLPVDQYLRVYSISSAYLQECELINPGFVSSEAGTSLNDWLRNHINYFIHRFHLNSLKSLIQECEKEIWKEVTDEQLLQTAQGIVNELATYTDFVESSGRTGYSGEQWLVSMDLSKPYPDPKAFLAPSPTILSDYRIRLGSKLFLIANLIVKTLRATKDYIILSKVFTNRSSIIGNNILNYYKLLNSRTSQAILGAGATRTAGLKHIFPKHMALCIQLIGFQVELLNKIEVLFPVSTSNGLNNGLNDADSNYTNANNANNNNDELNFSRIASNYKDHENELFGKLISMMYERTVNHCNTVKTIDWSEPIHPPHQCHQYMETLVKDTTTITKVLVKYLPEFQCNLVLLQVFENYKKLFVECYCTQIPQFKDFNEKHSLLKDIDFFRVKLGEIPGYGNSGQIIWENINSMPTVEDAKMEEIMRKNIEKERGINVATTTASAAQPEPEPEIEPETDAISKNPEKKSVGERELPKIPTSSLEESDEAVQKEKEKDEHLSTENGDKLVVEAIDSSKLEDSFENIQEGATIEKAKDAAVEDYVNEEEREDKEATKQNKELHETANPTETLEEKKDEELKPIDENSTSIETKEDGIKDLDIKHDVKAAKEKVDKSETADIEETEADLQEKAVATEEKAEKAEAQKAEEEEVDTEENPEANVEEKKVDVAINKAEGKSEQIGNKDEIPADTSESITIESSTAKGNTTPEISEPVKDVQEKKEIEENLIDNKKLPDEKEEEKVEENETPISPTAAEPKLQPKSKASNKKKKKKSKR